MQISAGNEEEVMGLKKYCYVIKNLDPLTFAEKSGDQVLYATKHYIPGSALRGALATQYINKNNLKDAHKNEAFFDLFLSGKVKFLPGYPIGGSNMFSGEPMVIPLSLMCSKDGTKTIDLSGATEYAPGFKKLQGFAVRTTKGLVKVAVDVKTEFHMSRSSLDERISGKSNDGNIFNYEYIKPNQYFKCCCLVDDDIFGRWENLMKDMNCIYLGRSRGAQYGKCSIEYVNDDGFSASINLNKKFYLCALTPYIPYNAAQSMEMAANELFTDLERALANTVRFERKGLSFFASVEQLDGYVGVWKTKKQKEIAISAGTLLPLNAVEGNLNIKKLVKVLRRGFGKNCIDGFGQFLVWQTFDGNILEYAESVARPDLNIDVKERAKLVVQNLISQRIKELAAQKASSDNLDMGADYKNVCKRVEILLREYSLDIVRDEIKHNFRNTAKTRLHKMKFCGNSIYDILMDADGYKKLNIDIKWDDPLNLGPEQVAAMRKDLGDDVFALDETFMKEFWLWFMRHAVK